jgi:hypothetical protein
MSSDQQTLICKNLAPGRTQSFPFVIIPLFVVSEAEVVIRVVIGCLGCLGVGDFGHQSVRILKSSISVYKNCKCEVWCKEEAEQKRAGRKAGAEKKKLQWVTIARICSWLLAPSDLLLACVRFDPHPCSSSSLLLLLFFEF